MTTHPLLSRDISTQEIYAFDLQLPWRSGLIYCTVPTSVPATVTGEARSAMMAAMVAIDETCAQPDWGPVARPRGLARQT